MTQFKTILCPTDFSEPAHQAFRLACSLASDSGGKVILVHVKSPSAVPSGVMAMPPEPQEVRDELQKQLDSVKPSAPGLTVERHLVAGNEADEILRLASELKCDLVVMGTHGRTGLRRLLLGSVAESVMRKAPCAVLTVRAPASAT